MGSVEPQNAPPVSGSRGWRAALALLLAFFLGYLAVVFIGFRLVVGSPELGGLFCPSGYRLQRVSPSEIVRDAPINSYRPWYGCRNEAGAVLRGEEAHHRAGWILLAVAMAILVWPIDIALRRRRPPDPL